MLEMLEVLADCLVQRQAAIFGLWRWLGIFQSPTLPVVYTGKIRLQWCAVGMLGFGVPRLTGTGLSRVSVCLRGAGVAAWTSVDSNDSDKHQFASP